MNDAVTKNLEEMKQENCHLNEKMYNLVNEFFRKENIIRILLKG